MSEAGSGPDRIDGFLVDRGFQVLNPAVPCGAPLDRRRGPGAAGFRRRPAGPPPGLPRGPRPPGARAHPDPADPAQRTAGPALCRGAAALGGAGVYRSPAASRQRRSAAGGPGPGRMHRRTAQGSGPVPRRSAAGRRGHHLQRIRAAAGAGLRDRRARACRATVCRPSPGSWRTPSPPRSAPRPGWNRSPGRGRGPGHRRGRQAPGPPRGPRRRSGQRRQAGRRRSAGHEGRADATGSLPTRLPARWTCSTSTDARTRAGRWSTRL